CTITAAPGSSAVGGRAGARPRDRGHPFLHERVPGAAVGALTVPLEGLVAALGAAVDDVPGHLVSVRGGGDGSLVTTLSRAYAHARATGRCRDLLRGHRSGSSRAHAPARRVGSGPSSEAIKAPPRARARPRATVQRRDQAAP